MTAKLRQLRLQEKAFGSGDGVGFKVSKYMLSKALKEAKWLYSEKLSSESVWKGLRQVTNSKLRAPSLHKQHLANRLSDFYCCFERQKP